MTAIPAQIPMPFPVATRQVDDTEARHKSGRSHYVQCLLPALQAAVHATTNKECTGLFNAQPSSISEALTGHEDARRHFQAEWIVQLLVHGSEPVKAQIVNAICDIAGYKPPEPKAPLTESDELRLARQLLRQYPGGIEWLEREKARYRP